MAILLEVALTVTGSFTVAHSDDFPGGQKTAPLAVRKGAATPPRAD